MDIIMKMIINGRYVLSRFSKTTTNYVEIQNKSLEELQHQPYSIWNSLQSLNSKHMLCSDRF